MAIELTLVLLALALVLNSGKPLINLLRLLLVQRRLRLDERGVLQPKKDPIILPPAEAKSDDETK